MSVARQIITFAGVFCLSGLAEAEINKCNINGQLVYQNRPCPSTETTEQHRVRKDSYKMLHRKLDQMQALGVGLVQHAPPRPPKPPPETEDDGRFVVGPRSWFELQAQEEEELAIDARLQEQTERNNAESIAKLTQSIDRMLKACGVDKPIKEPVVGMSDETFRNCTMLARFGSIIQIVASDDGGIPIRLYVFPSNSKITRVYSIDGVITAVKP
ncbi:MAG: hypothetical protein FWG81_07160 [Betaproteobacteria bacterium]|nr:hypothetical protein [Betaproteobacteria bacterium]